MSDESDAIMVAGASRTLRLPGVGANFAELVMAAQRDNWSHLHFLAELLGIELDLRDVRRAQRLLREAKIPRSKLLSGFDLDASALTRETLDFLLRGDFAESATSIILIGGPGTGKSHLLIGTLISLVSLGKRVRYVNAAALVNELAEAEDERRLSRVIERYRRLDALGIDELGYLHLDRRGAELLFQVITEREEASSLLVATNLPFGEWTGIFSDTRLAAAVVDRITFNAKIIETGSDSYRLRSAIAQKRSK